MPVTETVHKGLDFFIPHWFLPLGDYLIIKGFGVVKAGTVRVEELLIRIEILLNSMERFILTELFIGAEFYDSSVILLLLFLANSIKFMFLQCISPLLWICLIGSVFQRGAHRKNRKNNHETVTPMPFIIRKLLKNWGICFAILATPPVLHCIQLIQLNEFSLQRLGNSMIMADFLTSLALSIPIGYFSMIYYKDSESVPKKKRSKTG